MDREVQISRSTGKEKTLAPHQKTGIHTYPFRVKLKCILFKNDFLL